MTMRALIAGLFFAMMTARLIFISWPPPFIDNEQQQQHALPVADYGSEMVSPNRSTTTSTNAVVVDMSIAPTHHSTSAGPSKLLVLSYSLYGRNVQYLNGMIATASQVPAYYPNWQVRIYHDHLVPHNITATLSDMTHVQLVNVTRDIPWAAKSVNPMAWRFLIASDPTVYAYGIRDGDSQPSHRAKAAVDEWLGTTAAFHIMRDHPMHDPSRFAAILGGMWGGLHRAVPQMEILLKEYYCNASAAGTGTKVFPYAEDQDFLWSQILPLAMNDCLQHDAYYCDISGGIAFPTIGRDQFDFVGNAYNRRTKGASSKNEQRDTRLIAPSAKTRFALCERRRNETLLLSANVLPAKTPYIGRINVSSTQLWASTRRRKKVAQPAAQKKKTARLVVRHVVSSSSGITTVAT